MTELEIAQRNLKNDMVVLIILDLIFFVLSIFNGNINFYLIVLIAFQIYGYILSKNGSKSAGTFGIANGVLMMICIIRGDLIYFLLGLF